MALGQRIKTLRKHLQLTLEQLSERSGVDLGTIAALENRDSSRSKYAPQIAVALGVSLDDLLSDKEAEVIRRRPVPDSVWPFQHIDIARVLALPSEARDEVEADLLYSLDKAERRAAKKSRITKREVA